MKMSAITHRYQEEDVVTCLNRISSLNLNKDRQHQHHNNETTSVIQIAFIGDSTIRHLFNSFIRGKTKTTFLLRKGFQESRQVTSELLNLRVAFYWRHLADKKLFETFRDWTIYNDTTPDYIVMGILAHHTLDDSFDQFSKGLNSLNPILKQLTTMTRIVWMILPHGPAMENPNFLVKLAHYNKEARTILKNTGVKILDCIEHLKQEYTRGCTKNKQYDLDRWHECGDTIHIGFVVLEHGTQNLLNDMCNDLIMDLPIREGQKQETTC